jgi:hypothetical protein
MQEKKVWTLIALAGLTALTLVRSERDLDGRPASRPVRMPPESDGIASGSTSISGSSSTSTSAYAGPAWVLFRADWGAALWRVYQKMNDNRLLAVAAGVVFYGLLAVFPAITAFVSLYGLMADPSTIHDRLSLATGVLPQGALNILNEQLTRLTSHRTSALSVGFSGRYEGHYSRATLAAWRKSIKEWQQSQCDVYVYFDNDQKSAAPMDALALLRFQCPNGTFESSLCPSGCGLAGAPLFVVVPRAAKIIKRPGLLAAWPLRAPFATRAAPAQPVTRPNVSARQARWPMTSSGETTSEKPTTSAPSHIEYVMAVEDARGFRQR